MPDLRLMPDNLKESLADYVNDRIPTGDFLRAVLSNDLMEATGRADEFNGPLLPVICCYVYNELPDRCWGSPEKVRAWLAASVSG